MDFETIWQTAVDALHSGKSISRKDLDHFIQDETKGQIKTFAEFARVRMQHQTTLGTNQAAQAGTPTPAETFAESGANAMGLNLPSLMARTGSEPGGGSDMADFMNAGAEANPKSDFAGGMVGGAIPAAVGGAALTPILGKAAAVVPGIRALPSFLRTILAGGGAQVPGSLVSSVAGGASPGETAENAGLAFGLGAVGTAPAAWGATKLHPAEHYAGRAVQEATPGVPQYAAGRAALEEGSTTPYRIGRPNVDPTQSLMSVPLSEAEIAKMPPVLRPMNFERSQSLRLAAGKRIVESGEGAAQLENAITKRIAAVNKARQSIANDPATGYDALLEGRPVQNPDALQTYQQLKGTSEPPTARDLFTLQKSLDKQIDGAWQAKARGGAFDFAKTEALDQASALLRQTLHDEVPGFADLQSEVQPYFVRRSELTGQLRGVIGRTIKAIGKTAEKPAGGVTEGLKESYGAGIGQVGEEAARKLVGPMTSTNINDLFRFIEEGNPLAESKLKFVPGAKAGAAQGALTAQGPFAKKVRKNAGGLFERFFSNQEE